ncbi:MAG: STM4504/CBY_0614 family protein [Alphaproteobacteria bacterium]
MATQLYSTRKKQERGELYPDVFTYDHFPEPLKVQIFYLLERYITPDDSFLTDGIEEIEQKLKEEYGLFTLVNQTEYRDFVKKDPQSPFDYSETFPFNRIKAYFFQATNVDRLLDIVELLFRKFEFILEDQIKILNQRFREHGVGYAFENGQIIRKDNEFTHQQIIKPALLLLTNPVFANANAEFMQAHQHYRDGLLEEAIVACNKAFETTLKIICHKRGWPLEEKKQTAKPLLEMVMKNNLFGKEYLYGGFEKLTEYLQAFVAKTRNKDSAHGQGTEKREISEHLAEFIIAETANALRLFIKAYEHSSHP